MDEQVVSGRRRVVVGNGADGRSRVLADGPTSPHVVRPNGNVVHDLWQQDRLPARADDDGASHTTVRAEPPLGGAVVRTLTLAPRASAGPPATDLHVTPALFVITVLTGRVLVALAADECVLEVGDTIVLPGSEHDVANLGDTPAEMVFTAFPLAAGAPGER